MPNSFQFCVFESNMYTWHKTDRKQSPFSGIGTVFKFWYDSLSMLVVGDFKLTVMMFYFSLHSVLIYEGNIKKVHQYYSDFISENCNTDILYFPI